MRVANTAHLLAISGLHMGLTDGLSSTARFVSALALIPALALRYPIRKWAAAGALAAGAFYLALSGGNVATERAFIQVAVMLTAVMPRPARDHAAVGRNRPASIIPAAPARDACSRRGSRCPLPRRRRLSRSSTACAARKWLRVRPGWQKWVFALVLSSTVAGLATAPFAAAHFNRIAVFGLIANLLTVPVMGSLIIPGAVVAALLWPLGLSGLAFAVMQPGLAWILDVSARVAEMPGAVSHVPSPPAGTLGLIALGGAFRDPLAREGPLGGHAAACACGVALDRGSRVPICWSRTRAVLSARGRRRVARCRARAETGS